MHIKRSARKEVERNPVHVVDFTDLNNACPKDSYPLPKIGKLVGAIASHALLSFIDAFSYYHQILLHEND